VVWGPHGLLNAAAWTTAMGYSRRQRQQRAEANVPWHSTTFSAGIPYMACRGQREPHRRVGEREGEWWKGRMTPPLRQVARNIVPTQRIRRHIPGIERLLGSDCARCALNHQQLLRLSSHSPGKGAGESGAFGQRLVAVMQMASDSGVVGQPNCLLSELELSPSGSCESQ